VIDQAYQDRPGNKDIQLSILYNAKRNLDVYDDWQEYFRKHQPPTLITWGKNDGIFTVEGAELFKPGLSLPLYNPIGYVRLRTCRAKDMLLGQGIQRG
jgi:hypothetical protein